MTAPTRSRSLAPVFLLGGLGAFIAVIAYAVVTVFVQPDPPAFELSDTRPRPAFDTLVTDTVTVDAADPNRWVFVDLSKGAAVWPPDTAGWDLAFRRFNAIAAGGVADLGVVPFDGVGAAPERGYVATTYGPDTLNAAIERWYDYSFVSHTLDPNGHVYATRTPEGHYVKFQFLSYYCPGVIPGCVTVRYTYQPSGSRRFEGREQG